MDNLYAKLYLISDGLSCGKAENQIMKKKEYLSVFLDKHQHVHLLFGFYCIM